MSDELAMERREEKLREMIADLKKQLAEARAIPGLPPGMRIKKICDEYGPFWDPQSWICELEPVPSEESVAPAEPQFTDRERDLFRSGMAHMLHNGKLVVNDEIDAAMRAAGLEPEGV